MENHIRTDLVILIFVAVFGAMAINHYFFTETYSENDLNKDGEVTLQDFSIALYRVEQIQEELRNQNVPENVIEDVYPPVPLPYQPSN